MDTMIWRLAFPFCWRDISTTKRIRLARPSVFFASVLEKIEKRLKAVSATDATHPSLLLADDDSDDREMFEEAITKINPRISVTTLSTGTALLQHLQKGKLPEMIFLDLNMPGRSGKECLAEIMNNEQWKSIPVVIYSTSANNRDVNDTFSAGASLYLLKPNSFNELTELIKRVISIDLERTPISQQEYLITGE